MANEKAPGQQDPIDQNQQKLNEFFGGDLKENPSDDLLNRMESFIEAHCSSLHQIEEKFAEHNITDTWDSRDDFLSLDVAPYENVDNPVFLVEDRTDNPVFNKITTVISALCQEQIELQKTARREFYDPLSMFGIIPNENEMQQNTDQNDEKLKEEAYGSSTTMNGHSENENKTNANNDNNSIEMQIARFLPFLQNLCNFVLRINSVIKNSIEQLAYLYHPKQKLYISTYKNVSMDYFLDRLSQTLSILVTLDIIVRENEELKHGWENYKKMIGYMRTTPDSMGFENDELNDFQHQIMRLESIVLNSKMYSNCIHQKFGVLSKVPTHLESEYFTILRENQVKEEVIRDSKAQIQQMRVVSANRALFEEIDRYLKYIQKRLKSELKGKEIHHRQSVVDLFSLYGLSNEIFTHSAAQDKSFYKSVWSVQHDIPLVHLHGRAVWYLADFMREHIPYSGKTLDPPYHKIDNSRRLHLLQLDKGFNDKVNALYMAMCQWLIKWDAEIKSKIRDIQTTLKFETRLLIDGLILATQIHNLLTTTLWLHLDLGINFKKSNLRSLTILAELLKSIEDAFHRRSKRLSADVSYMLTVIAFSLQHIFEPLRKRIDAEPRPSSAKLDCLAALTLCVELLNTAPTLSRLVVVNVSSAVCTLRGMMSDSDCDEVRYRLWKLSLVATWQDYLHRVTNTSFFYWSIDFIPLILRDIFDSPSQAHRLPNIFAYLNDVVPMLKANKHEANSNRIFRVYKEDIFRFLNHEIINPLCTAIENDLRLHVMDMMDQKFRERSQGMFGLSSRVMSATMTSLDAKQAKELVSGGKKVKSTTSGKKNVKVKKLNKKQQKEAAAQMEQAARDLGRFMLLKPFRVLDSTLDIKKSVEFYVDKTFYNMATVALHAWEVYAEMRSLAVQKYHLELIENHIPSQSHFSEGLDVLEIMRNIHVFVRGYTYNLNSQIFVERAFDQLHLNSINVQHVANSIKTHGPGIMPTTVNFAYQFCISKFLIFSEFLYDDHVKSKLIRNRRYFEDNKDKLNNRYPYDKASKFVQFMRNLGQDQKGKSFIDHFRTLITQIGNALGYVRMVRSGGLYYTSQAIQYVPDIDDIGDEGQGDNGNNGRMSFKEQVENAKLSKPTISSADNLDTVLNRLSKDFSVGVDYFNMLVTAFQKVLSTADHGHLRNFAIIMPPLTLNFVESMLRKKDRLNRKKNKQDEAGFTDDGFALGCAFLLRVLGLYEDFDSLHWWETVEIWLSTKDKKLQQSKNNMQGSKGRDDGMDDEEEEWNISYKRNMALSKEWKLLFFGFQASRIFFRVVEDKKEGDEEKKNENETKGKGVDDDEKKDTKGGDDNQKNEKVETPGGDSLAPPPPQKPAEPVVNSNPYPTPTSPNDADVDEWAGSSSNQQNQNGYDQPPVPDDGLGF